MATSQKTNGKQMAGKREDGTFAPGHKLGNRFSKGVSGNPNGRPKITRLTDALRQQISETNPDADERTVAEQIAGTLIKLALGGDVTAIKEVFDRCEGRPKQAIDLDVQATSWRDEAKQYGITQAEVAAEARLLLAEFDTGISDEATDWTARS